MRVAISTVLMTIVLAGCAAPPPQAHSIHISAPFDSAHALRLLAPGTNTVTGSALIRQRGGGIVSCAGSRVYLIPATSYAEQRLSLIYRGGRYAAIRSSPPIFTPDPPEYTQQVRVALCNAQGLFRFDAVADGDFFVQATIVWQVAGHREGGHLMERVSVRGGQAVDRVLAP